MNNKKKYSSKGHIYELGTEQINAIAGAASTGLGMIGNAVSGASNVKDIQSVQQGLANYANVGSNINSTNDLLAQYGTSVPQAYKTSDFTDMNFTSAAMDALTQTASGAASGASLGAVKGLGIGAVPGAIGGAILGFTSSLGKSLGTMFNARRNSNLANKLRASAITQRNNGLANANNNLAQNTLFNMEANYSAFGGPLYTEDFTNGVTEINAGNIHEANPNGGVPAGIAQDGQPNLVEEGEVIYGDYVFSNRLKVPKEVRNKYKLREQSFADAFKKIEKESKERPNDPISKKGLDAFANDLAQAQEEVRARKESNKYSNGGHLLALGDEPEVLDSITAVGDANTNSVLAKAFLRRKMAEQVKLNTPKSNLAPRQKGIIGESFLPSADITPIKATTELGNFGVVDRRLPAWLDPTLKPFANPFASTTLDPVDVDKYKVELDLGDLSSKSRTEEGFSKVGSWLRYADPLANLTAVGMDLAGLTNKPTTYNYIPTYNPIAPNPLGNYLAYNPFDTRTAVNQAEANAAATRRALMQSTSPSRDAAIVAADYNAINSLGDIYRKAQEYNLAQRQQVETFNRDTNKTNSAQALQADMANRENALKYAQAKLQQAKYNEDSTNVAWQGRAANIGNLAESIANIGRENDAYLLSKAAIRSGVPLNDAFKKVMGIQANGGKLTRKKKSKNFTF